MQSLRPAFDTDPCFVTPVTQKVDLIFNVTSGESLILSWGDLGELRHGRCNALKANLPNVIEFAIGGDHGNARSQFVVRSFNVEKSAARNRASQTG